jgi:hypothetical protein
MKPLRISLVIVVLFALSFGTRSAIAGAATSLSETSYRPVEDGSEELWQPSAQKKAQMAEDLTIPIVTDASASPPPWREISYYPRDYPWREMWLHWPQAALQMDADLDRVQALGANTVRIFLQPDVFGYPSPTATTLGYFEQALDLIAAHGLKAHVNLFDCWQSYEDVSGSQTWLSDIVEPHKSDPRIAAWELRNEVGLNEPRIRNWVQAMFPFLRQQAGTTPLTVSVSDVEWLDDIQDLTGSTPPDIYSLHWYPGPVPWTSPFPAVIDRARQLIGPAELLIGEFGLSTHAYSDLSQADLYTDVLYYAYQKGITNLGVWTLNDFAPGTVGCDGPLKNEEVYFGLYRNDGSPKPAAPILQAAFHDNPPGSPSPVRMRNTSFEDRNLYSQQLDNWWPWDEQWTWQLWGVQDCAVAHNGHCAARLSAPVAMPAGLYNVPALRLEPGRLYSVEGYVKTENLVGYAQIVFSWYDGNAVWMRDTISPPITDPNLTQWKRISIDDKLPPDGARYVQVHIQMRSTVPSSYVWFDDVTTLTKRIFLPLILK